MTASQPRKPSGLSNPSLLEELRLQIMGLAV